MSVRAALVVLASTVAVSCSGGAPAGVVSPSVDEAVAIPTQSEGEPIEEALIIGILSGDPDEDGGCLWLETADGTRLPTLWPPGYRARFDPTALIDPQGAVVAEEGDLIEGRGGAAEGKMERCQFGQNEINRISEPKVSDERTPSTGA